MFSLTSGFLLFIKNCFAPAISIAGIVIPVSVNIWIFRRDQKRKSPIFAIDRKLNDKKVTVSFRITIFNKSDIDNIFIQRGPKGVYKLENEDSIENEMPMVTVKKGSSECLWEFDSKTINVKYNVDNGENPIVLYCFDILNGLHYELTLKNGIRPDSPQYLVVKQRKTRFKNENSWPVVTPAQPKRRWSCRR